MAAVNWPIKRFELCKHKIKIAEDEIGDEGCKQIVNASWISSLEILSLGNITFNLREMKNSEIYHWDIL